MLKQKERMKNINVTVDEISFFPIRREDTRLESDCVSDVCFFFSSRRRHTRLQGDWSSDVCSSDLRLVGLVLLDATAGWRRDLDERESAHPFGSQLEQALHGAEPFLDAFGIVEPVHPDADRVIQRQPVAVPHVHAALLDALGDRKSTRLNSSHLVISYAVFCLKKKKNTH